MKLFLAAAIVLLVVVGAEGGILFLRSRQIRRWILKLSLLLGVYIQNTRQRCLRVPTIWLSEKPAGTYPPAFCKILLIFRSKT